MLVKRAVAILMDSILVGIIGSIVGAIIGDQNVGFIVSFIIGILYQVFFLTSWEGQTPGKKVMGIRVVMMDGGPIGPVQAGLRYIGYYINTFLLFIGWIVAIITGRGFHDMIAGTQVVDA